MAPTNALKTMIEADTMIPLASYISEIDKAHHHASFGDDYAAPCKWYVRGLDNLGVDEEKQALKEGKMKAKLEIPTLMIGGLRDAVCPADQARASMRKTVEGGEKGGLLRVVDVDAGHVSSASFSFPFHFSLFASLPGVGGERDGLHLGLTIASSGLCLRKSRRLTES